MAQVGLEPTAFEILSLDGLPLPTEPGVFSCANAQRGSRTPIPPGLSRIALPLAQPGFSMQNEE